MEKKLIAVCMAGLFVLSMTGMASALNWDPVNTFGDDYEDLDNQVYSFYQNSGNLVGEVLIGNLASSLKDSDGNVVDLEEYIETKLGFESDEFFLSNSSATIKVEGWDGDSGLDELGSSSDGKVDEIADGYSSGIWTVMDPSSSELQFYSVKGSTFFALYYLDPTLNSGGWSTYDLQMARDTGNDLSISHYNGFNATTSQPVPEPATMLLFGTGLVGLAGIARKRNKK